MARRGGRAQARPHGVPDVECIVHNTLQAGAGGCHNGAVTTFAADARRTAHHDPWPVRKRLDLTRPVPLELIRECLEIALQAPLGCEPPALASGWSSSNPEVRKQIGEIYLERAQNYAASDTYVSKLHGDDPQRSQVQQRVGDSTEYLAPAHGGGTRPGHPVPQGRRAACGQSGPASGGRYFPATWSYMLAGPCPWIGDGPGRPCTLAREREVCRAARACLTTSIRPRSSRPRSNTGENIQGPRPREPLDTVLHVDKW